MIEIKPIDLKTHKDLCIAFRADSFVASFGNADKFHEADGKGAERYIEWLKTKMAKDPSAAVHVWEDGKIIGQMEFGRLKNEPSFGYVNLYYLVPEKRGQGLGTVLDRHAMDYFRKLGCQTVRLSVSPTNKPALAYYKKMGWRDLGPRPGHPDVHFMEKTTQMEVVPAAKGASGAL